MAEFDPTTARPEAEGFDPTTAVPEAPPPARGFKGWAGDALGVAARGAISVPEAVVGLADIPTGGAVGKFLENEGGSFGFRPKQAKEAASQFFDSEATTAQNREFDAADGFVDKAKVVLQNPTMIGRAVAESVPSMVAGGVAARGLQTAAKVGPVLAGALGEGAVAAGSAAEQIRQETADGRLTPTQAGLAAATGVATAGFGALGGKVANKLSIGDADTMLAQGAKGIAKADADAAARAATNPLVQQQAVKSIPRQVIEGAIAEGFLEELPQSVAEQVFQNLALGQDWLKDVDGAAVMGLLTGGAMGGGAAGYRAATRPTISDADVQRTADARVGREQAAAAEENAGLARMRQAFNAQLDAASKAAPVLDEGALQAAGVPRAVPKPVLDLQQLDRGLADMPPSARMGLDPAAGPMSGAAALAVDTGVTDGLQQAAAAEAQQQQEGEQAKQAQAQAEEMAASMEKAAAAGRKAAVEGQRRIDLTTGELLEPDTIQNWTDEQLANTFRGAQNKGVRMQMAKELSRRRAEALQRELADEQSAPEPTAPGLDAGFASVTEDAGTLIDEGTNGRTTPTNPGTQAAPARAAKGPARAPAAGDGSDDAGATWTRTPTAEREAILARAEGLKPIQRKMLKRVPWADMNPSIQKSLANAIANPGPAVAQQAQTATKTVAKAPTTAAEKAGVTIVEVEDGFDAIKDGKRVGRLRDNLPRGAAQQLNEDASVDIVKVDDEVKGTGVGSALYDAFNEKHGGRITPSGKTSKDAWNLWKRKFPERVEAFVQAEAERIRDGASPSLVLGNITDPDIATRVQEAAAAAPSGAVDAAAADAAMSPKNDRPEPTQAQREAGNYKKGHVVINGLDISIETPAGTRRRPEWPPLKDHYGYFKGTVGVDKDHVDVFLTDRAEDTSLPVFVVDQNNKDGSLDEHKVIMGATDEANAREVYLRNYAKGWTGLGGIAQMTQDEFKAWVFDSAKTKKRVGLYQQAQAATENVATPGAIVEHVTGRGKTLRGVVRTDLTKEQAQAIDEYTFKKDDGWFIREKYLENQAPALNSKAPAATKNVAQPPAPKAAPRPAPAPAPATVSGIKRGVVVTEIGRDGLSEAERAAGKVPLTDRVTPTTQREALEALEAGKVLVKDSGTEFEQDVWIAEEGKGWVVKSREKGARATFTKGPVGPDRQWGWGKGDAARKAIEGMEFGVSATPAAPAPTSNTGPVTSLFTGAPDPKNSGSMESLEGFKPGDVVDVPSRTIGRSTIEAVFRRKMAGFDPEPMARLIAADGKRLDVAISEIRLAEEPVAAPAPAKPKVNPAQARAKADLMAALADLGDILGKNGRMNIVPEQEQKLLPVLTRLLDAAFRLGYHKFKDSAKFALDQIRTNLGDEAADALTLDHLQGAYIGMAGGKKGADTKRTVIDVETKAEIEAHEAVAEDDATEAPAPAPEVSEKERWLNSVADMNRMSGQFGAQIDGIANGRLSIVGNPNATKQGKALMAAVDEARRAGATTEEIAAAATGKESEVAKPTGATLKAALAAEVEAGRMPKDNPALKKLVESYDGAPATPARMKEAQEALEAVIVDRARAIVQKNRSEGPKTTFAILGRLYESQPLLNVRTSTSIENQAYSTPAPLAYLASRLAGIDANTTVLEPTAGNGMLLIGADPAKAIANELNPERAAELRAQGFARVTERDAVERVTPLSVDAVITNPPFGSIKDANGKTTKVKVDGYSLGQIDHLIAARALEAMKDDGRAVLILGANKVPGGISNDDLVFFNWLYSHYDVRGHFEADGKLYQRQGAGWPVRVITIAGRKASKNVSPASGTVPRVDTWEEVYDQYERSMAASGPVDPLAAESAGRANGIEAKPLTAPQPAGPAPAAAGGREPAGGAASPGAVAGGSPRAVGNRGEREPAAVGAGPGQQRGVQPPAVAGGLEPDRQRAGEPARAIAVGDPGNGGVADNEFQVAYVARSERKDAGVLIPRNMADPTQAALNRLEDAVGSIDEFAAKELGYLSTSALHNALMGLQIDSVASAIYQIKAGKGTIIADQTGIGKGRQAAAIIRWAVRNGKTPVFVTVKPSLFTDMFGDLADIGTDDVAPFIMNVDESIKGQGGERLFANKATTHRRAIQQIAETGQLPDGRNAVFMTYSQINVANAQRTAIEALAPNAVFILDESHNAGGDSATGAFIRGVLDQGQGVTYLSATYAKRPDNMPVYFKTDIGEAVADDATLMEAMSAGGLPLQTVVANNLVKAGQMFRRERSYDGVNIANVTDTPKRAEHEKLSDAATSALREIVAADGMFHNIYVKARQEEAKQEGARMLDMAGNQASQSVNHTEFSSVVHNFVRQMLLGLKAQTAAEEAVASLKRGEKPLIAVENTMGSFLAEYAENNGIRPGAPLGNFDYRTVLSRALERTRYIVMQDSKGDKTKIFVSLDELDGKTREAYDRAQAVIDSLDIDIPVSPIDWMRYHITKAGYSVAEITGRNLSVDYSGKRPVLSAIDQQEQRDKVETTRRFNDGRLDAVILNVAGSTGISLHASEKFADRRQRHMIVAQPAQDINIFMQMLGRIHRTGQVALPKYTILGVDLPAEKRPMALTADKMKSLNANTSSNTESATSVQAVSLLNKYGDQVVAQYLDSNLELARALGIDTPLDSEGNATEEDMARKATGRLALMPVKVQQDFYDEVEDQYRNLINYLNETNQNDLEPRTFDFDAKETSSQVLFEGENPATPFGEDAIYGEYSIKAQGKPMTPAEIKAAIAEHLEGKTFQQHAQALIDRLDPDLERYLLKLDDAGREQALNQARAMRQYIADHAIGAMFRVQVSEETYNAVVTNIRSTHKSNGNPYAASKLQITIALNGSLRSLTVPATQFKMIEVSAMGRRYSIESTFQQGLQTERETAKIITGNLLAAYGELKGVRGTIISFTKSDGTSDQGILLPKGFNVKANTQGDYRFRTGAEAYAFLMNSTDKNIDKLGISTRDQAVRVVPVGAAVTIRVPKSKARGAKFFLDKKLIEAAGSDFVSTATTMNVTVPAERAARALDVLADKQALYALPSMAEEAKAMGEASNPAPLADDEDAFGVPTSEAFSRWFKGSKVVDADGKPLVVYHGTAGDFSKFARGEGGGMWFSSTPDIANQHASRLSEGGNVMPVYLSMKNPVVIEGGRADVAAAINEAYRNGHDGVIARNKGDLGADGDIYFVRSPEQIKSAIGNRGTYDPESPDISQAPGSSGAKVGTPADRAVMGLVQAGAQAQDILKLIAGTSRSLNNRRLAEALVKAGIAPKVKMGGDLGGRSDEFKYIAQYTHSADTITMTPLAAAQAEQVFLHEATHAATVHALAKRGLASIQMNRLFKHVEGTGAAAQQYGMTNVREFVAEAFSNPEFQAALKAMPAPRGSTLRTAWDEFVRIVRNFLGLTTDPTPGNSVLDEVMRAGAALMRENAAATGRGDPGAEISFAAAPPTESEAFKRWFGDSKVVDAAGQPLRVFHGSTSGEITAFQPDADGAIYFTSNAVVASDYSRGRFLSARPGGGTVYPAFLALRNPLVIDAAGKRNDNIPVPWGEWKPKVFGNLPQGAVSVRDAAIRAKQMGHDGLIVRNVVDTASITGKEKGDVFVAFEPTQVKSAIGNRGTYDPDNADISYFGTKDMAALKDSALAQIDQAMNAPGQVSVWDKTVGTMRNLAERSPEFKPVFESAQQFIDDVAMLASDAADAGPRLMPRVDTLRDLKFWGQKAKKPVSAEDNAGVARPLFEGTLLWGRDVDGKAVRVDDLQAKYSNLSADDKARQLLLAGRIAPEVLRMWQGLPVEQFENLINSQFNSKMLKPGVLWSEKELKEIFGATDTQVSLYQEARKAIDRSLDMTTRADMLRVLGKDFAGMRDVVLDAPTLADARDLLTNELQQQARENPEDADRLMDLNNAVVDRYEKITDLIAHGYAPLSRFGRYTVDVVAKDGKREYFGMFETPREANKMAERMRAEFRDATVTQGTMSEQSYKLFQGITPESLEMFGNMLGMSTGESEAKDKAFQAYLQLTKNNQSALKRLIHRKGIAGYSEDVGRVLANFTYSNARLGAGALNAGRMEQAIQGIPKEQGQLRDVAISLREYISDPQEEGQAIRGMLFAQYLGGSIASAFVNTTQPFAVTMPWLSQFGGMRKAAGQLTRAMRDMGAKGFRYEADLADALHHAEDDGIVSPQEIHQLMAQARGAGTLSSGDGTRLGNARAAASNTWERTKVLWGQPFALAEQFNRRSTFIAAYRLAKEQKLGDPAAFARKAVLETQFLYSKANKPRWARGAVGGTLMTFKTYSISYLELLNRTWNAGAPGSPQRAAGRRAVAWSMVMLMLMGGGGGLPFVEDLEDLIDGIGQLMGYNISSKQWRKKAVQEVVGKELGEFLDNGLSGLPGAPIDVSGRLGMGNLIPGTGLLLTKPSRERDLMELAGPAGDLVARGFTSARKVLTGDVGGAALEVAPTAVRNAVKGVDMATSGIYKDTKGYKVIDTTLDESLAKAIGFQPRSVAQVQEANSFMQRSKSFYTQTSAEIKAQWADALFNKDEAALERVRARLESWNANNPDQPIVVKMPDVWKRVREMGKDRTTRIAETAPKALRQQMQEMARDS